MDTDCLVFNNTSYEPKPLVSQMKNEIAKRETPEEKELRKKKRAALKWDKGAS